MKIFIHCLFTTFFFVFAICAGGEYYINYAWAYEAARGDEEKLFSGPPLIDEEDEAIYISTVDNMVRLDYDGRIIWEVNEWHEYDVNILGPPDIHEGYVYINSASFFYKIDKQTGEISETVLASNAMLQSPCAVIIRQDSVFLAATGTSMGRVVLFEVKFGADVVDNIPGFGGCYNLDFPYTVFGMKYDMNAVLDEYYYSYDYSVSKECESCNVIGRQTIQRYEESLYDYTLNFTSSFSPNLRPFVMQIDEELDYVFIVSFLEMSVTKMRADIFNTPNYREVCPLPDFADLSGDGFRYTYPYPFLRYFTPFYFNGSVIFSTSSIDFNSGVNTIYFYIKSVSLDDLEVDRSPLSTFSLPLKELSVYCGYQLASVSSTNGTLLSMFVSFPPYEILFNISLYEIHPSNSSNWVHSASNTTSVSRSVDNIPCQSQYYYYSTLAQAVPDRRGGFYVLVIHIDDEHSIYPHAVAFYISSAGEISSFFDKPYFYPTTYTFYNRINYAGSAVIFFSCSQNVSAYSNVMGANISFGDGGDSYWSFLYNQPDNASLVHLVMSDATKTKMIYGRVYQESPSTIVKTGEHTVDLGGDAWVAPLGIDWMINGTLSVFFLCQPDELALYIFTFDFETLELRKKFVSYESSCSTQIAYGLALHKGNIIIGRGREIYSVYSQDNIDGSHMSIVSIPEFPSNFYDMLPVDRFLQVTDYIFVIPSPFLSYAAYNGYNVPFLTGGLVHSMITPCYYGDGSSTCERISIDTSNRTILAPLLLKDHHLSLACINFTLNGEETAPTISDPLFNNDTHFLKRCRPFIYGTDWIEKISQFKIISLIDKASEVYLRLFRLDAAQCKLSIEWSMEMVKFDNKTKGEVVVAKYPSASYGDDARIVILWKDTHIFALLSLNSCLPYSTPISNENVTNYCNITCPDGLSVSLELQCALCSNGQYSKNEGKYCVDCGAGQWCPPGTAEDSYPTPLLDIDLMSRTDDVTLDVNDPSLSLWLTTAGSALIIALGIFLLCLMSLLATITSMISFLANKSNFYEELMYFHTKFYRLFDLTFQDMHLHFISGHAKYSGPTPLGGLFTIGFVAFGIIFTLSSAISFLVNGFIVSESMHPMTIEGVSTKELSILLSFRGFYGDCDDNMDFDLSFEGLCEYEVSYQKFIRSVTSPKTGTCDFYLTLENPRINSSASVSLKFNSSQFASQIYYSLTYCTYEVDQKYYGTTTGGENVPEGYIIRGLDPTVFKFQMIPNKLIVNDFSITGKEPKSGLSLSYHSAILGSVQKSNQYSNIIVAADFKREYGFEVRIDFAQTSIGTYCVVQRKDSITFVLSHVIATLSGVLGIFGFVLLSTETVLALSSFDVSPELADDPLDVGRVLDEFTLVRRFNKLKKSKFVYKYFGKGSQQSHKSVELESPLL